MRRQCLTLAASLIVLTGAMAPMAGANQIHCPPGLAKKAVPCVPPGQVGKSWFPGDQVTGEYVLVPRELWEAWGLPEPEDENLYLQIDGTVLKVLRDTMVVVEAIGIIDGLIN